MLLTCPNCGYEFASEARQQYWVCLNCGFDKVPVPEIRWITKPANRVLLIEWVKTFHTESVEEFREALLWRLRDEDLFPWRGVKR